MKIFLAVTCYDHKIYGECSEALLKNSVTLMTAGHTIIPYYSNDLYIDRSRNVCVDLFLGTDCTDLVFIDSDLSFEDDGILKLLEHDKDIVAGVYPYKKDQKDFPVTLDFSRNNNCKDEETGLAYATRVPTGFMRIQRRVFDKLEAEEDERNIIQYFKTGMVIDGDPNWWGEDTYFCRKCVEAGIEIFVNPYLNFKHIGNKEYKGNLYDFITNQYKTLVNCVQVDGWLSTNEESVLKFLASQSSNAVEIGSWKGKSTKVLLDNCKRLVYSVDHWKGANGDMTKAMAGDYVYEEFIKNVGSYPNLRILKGLSLEMVKFFDDYADLIYIDADHTYEGCKADIEAWMPKCKKFLCGHDYSFPGVKKAVDEKFNKVNVVDSFWWIEVKDGDSTKYN